MIKNQLLTFVFNQLDELQKKVAPPRLECTVDVGVFFFCCLWDFQRSVRQFRTVGVSI